MIMNAVIFTMAVLLLCDSSSAQRIEPNKVYATAWPACDSGSAFDIKAANQAASSKPWQGPCSCNCCGWSYLEVH